MKQDLHAMSNNYLFSVIIPTYNRAEQLERCLNALLTQTYKNFEVLVCDDGSIDNTSEIVKQEKYADLNLKYFHGENFGGPARARNTGIREAKGDWVCFLDSDDWWFPEKLEYCKKYISQHDVISHSLYAYFSDGKRKKMKTFALNKNAFVRLMSKRNTVLTSSACVKKDVLQKVGFFSEDKNLIAVEDFDLWLRVARAGYRFKVIAKCLGGYWSGGGNISGAGNKHIKRLKEVYERHLPFLKNKLRVKQACAYRDFQIARIKYEMKEYDEATKYFISSLKNGRNTLRGKAFIYLLLSVLHHKN